MSGRYTVHRARVGGLRTWCTCQPPPSHRPTESTNPSCSGFGLLRQQVHVVAEARERLGKLGVVDVRPRAAQQVAVEDQEAQGAASLDNRSARAAGELGGSAVDMVSG